MFRKVFINLALFFTTVTFVFASERSQHYANRQKLIDYAASLAQEPLILFHSQACSWARDLLFATVKSGEKFEIIGYYKQLPSWDPSVGEPHDWQAYAVGVEDFLKEMNEAAKLRRSQLDATSSEPVAESRPVFLDDEKKTKSAVGCFIEFSERASARGQFFLERKLTNVFSLHSAADLIGPAAEVTRAKLHAESSKLLAKLAQNETKCSELIAKRDELDAEIKKLQAETAILRETLGQ
ncbi:MAG: hypothetical protein AB7F43_10105 [Bacteriovoracia bacterium]